MPQLHQTGSDQLDSKIHISFWTEHWLLQHLLRLCWTFPFCFSNTVTGLRDRKERNGGDLNTELTAPQQQWKDRNENNGKAFTWGDRKCKNLKYFFYNTLQYFTLQEHSLIVGVVSKEKTQVKIFQLTVSFRIYPSAAPYLWTSFTTTHFSLCQMFWNPLWSAPFILHMVEGIPIWHLH